MKILQTFETYHQGWMWRDSTGTDWRTGSDGCGLFKYDVHGNLHQTMGTCDFRLPRDRTRAVRKAREIIRHAVEAEHERLEWISYFRRELNTN